MADEHDDAQEKPEPTPLEVTIAPEHLGGVWANFARVSHSPHEFTIDFVRIDFGGGQIPLPGTVVARVAVSPLFITQLIAALTENWERYAERAMPREVFDADSPGSGDGENSGE
jgi:hypothetical protein